MINNLLSKFEFSGNWIDGIFVAIVLFFALTNNGFISSAFEILGFIFSFLSSFKLYPVFSKILISKSLISKSLADALSFFIVWIISEAVFFIIIKFILKKVPQKFIKKRINKILGVFPGAAKGVVIFIFILTFIFALPATDNIKKAIMNSKTGPPLINISQKVESSLKNIFQDAVSETLNFITIKQNSKTKIDLGFKLSKNNLKKDAVSETAMFNLINKERRIKGFTSLKFDQQLTNTARQYAEEILTTGSFSHYSSKDNASPAQRLDRHAVQYEITGENLALAANVQIAHNGLMNSKGHRKNILSPDFCRVGIGVIDAGILGKIFVQEFTN